MEYVLRTHSLTKVYRGRAACSNVSINVPKGGIYGFIGQNGAGKTTLIRMIAGLARPNGGSMELFGQSSEAELERMRMRLGCMIEAPSFYPNMTAKQNLEAHRIMLGIPERESVNVVLKIVNLDYTGNKKAKNFSLGMKQRLGLAISLLGNPDILLLDEPTNGLDPQGIKEIRELLHKLSSEYGISILISSHILSELEKFATHYGVISNGVLVDEFSAGELAIRCKQCIEIKANDPKHAAFILETKLGATNYTVMSDGIIKLYEMLDRAGEINSVLAKNDIIVERITSGGQDLESYFVSLMSTQEGHANV